MHINIFQEDGDYSEVYDHFLNTFEKSSNNVPSHKVKQLFQQGKELITHGKIQRGIQKLEELISLDRHWLLVWITKGNAHLQ
ncbi:MAG: hypothetical protein AAF824_22485, partial [Bacteroidota bacterium]